ncbi:MAG: hypothetical protein ACP5OK_08850 [Thermoprotei archaeon]
MRSGFKIIKSYYSTINELTYVNAEESRQYLALGDYPSLVKHALANLTRTNMLRLLAYPLVKLVPSLRQLLVVVAGRIGVLKTMHVERW